MDECFEKDDSHEKCVEDSGSDVSFDSESDEESDHESGSRSKVKVSSHKAPNKQMSRIEVKINQMYSCLVRVQRMVTAARISDSDNSNKSHILTELPVMSVDSLNKFESELGDPTYRKEVVSKLFFP